MQKHSSQIFTTPLFLLCLSLLICNDWIWKAQFGNEWTGKISDFAGLAVFPLFWAAFFPRFKKHTFVLTAIVFIWWKSPYCQFFIEAWNSVVFFPLARVADYTDLWALLVLPFAYHYQGESLCFRPSFSLPHFAAKPLTFFIVGVSSFAFVATSIPPSTKQMEIVYDESYLFPFSKEELQNRIFNLYQKYDIGAHLELPETTRYGSHIEMERNEFIEKHLKDTTYLDFRTSKPLFPLMLPDIDTHIVQVVVGGNSVSSTLDLIFLAEYGNGFAAKKEYSAEKMNRFHKKLLKKFEKKVVRKLRKE